MDHYSNRVVKGYELKSRVGTGGFGAVYRAYQPSVGREVAVKVILPERANQLDFIHRFEVEAQLIARLEHPHIVPLYDYWRDPEGAFLVMRWLPTSLRAAIQRGPWPVEAAARLLEQISAALAIAHRAGIVHRDIKPDNILLDEDDNAYLADFGIAKALSMREGAEEDLIRGSPAYLTPEQIRDEPVTAQSDIYSLGLVLYEMLAGEKPFPGATTPSDLRSKHLNTPLPPLSVRRSNLPAALNEVIQMATAKDPAHRYTTALRFAAAFRAATPALHRGPTQPLADPLTDREMEILQLIGTGLASKEIAARLHLTGGTVKWYVNQIYSKLDVHNRHQAVDRARQLNLLAAPSEGSALIAYDNGLSAITLAPALPPGSPGWPIVPELANPYKGLYAFQEADTSDFFGRAALTEKLLTHLAEGGNHARFLAVVGPSGSGKSSVVKAGLIPALRRGALPHSKRWLITEMLPGTHPFEELEAALLRIAISPLPGLLDQLTQDQRGLVRAAKRVLPSDPAVDLVLVIDQFEELFTLLADERNRLRFIDNLLSAATDPHSRVRVVLTLRADFYGRPLLYPRLAELMGNHTEVVVPLDERELEQAILGPAARVGVSLEPGLINTIMSDVGQQPGALPLLQYALTELFEHRTGNTLTLVGYHQTGGISGALARRADELYGGLDADGQAMARQVFLRLISLGEGTEDTRRRTLQTELPLITGGERALEEVISTFGQYRLLTFDRDPITRSPTVEVAHEALIRTWQRLRDWLDESREDLRLHRRLTLAATEWAAANREPSYLATGMRLDQFEQWAQDTTLTLNQEERIYLDVSLAEREGQQAREDARKAQEAKIAQRAQNFGRAAAVLAIVGVLAVFATVVAITQAVDAHTQVEVAAQTLTPISQTLTPVPVTLTAVGQKIEAGKNQVESLRLAALANGELQNPEGSAESAVLLGIHALKIGYSPQANDVLMLALDHIYTRQVFIGHSATISAVAFSPDGRTILTGSYDSTARLWDVATGRTIRTFSGHTSAVQSVAFSPDGRTILTGSSDTTARLWDVATGRTIRTFSGHTSVVQGVAFAPDGRTILTGSYDKTARLWDVATGQPLHTFSDHTDIVYSVAFSPDGKTILTGGGNVFGNIDGSAALWDAATGQLVRILTGHTEIVTGVAWSPDGKTILTGSGDDTARLWDAATGQLLHILTGHMYGLTSVAFSPDGKTILTGGNDNTARLWDAATGQLLRTLSGHLNIVGSVALSPDGKTVLTGSYDSTARLWDMASGEAFPTFSGHTRAVYGLVFSPDGKTILTGSDDKTARLWDVASGQTLRTFSGHNGGVTSVAFSPDGKTILTGSADKTSRLWDVASGDVLRTFVGHTGAVWGVAFSPDGKTILTGSADKTARLWDVASGQTLRTFSGHNGGVTSVAFAPDGKTILTGSDDKTFRLWDAANGQVLRTFAGHMGGVTSAAFAPDGKTILTGSYDKTARLWDVTNGQVLRTFAGHTGGVTSVAFSPDSKTILTGSYDKTARLWDVADDEALYVFAGHTNSVWSVAFSPDSKTILTGSADKTARLREADYRDFIAYACAHVFRDFAAAERQQFNIPDKEPTCPQLGEQSPPMPPTTTPLPNLTLPVWTPIASPTPINTATITATIGMSN